MSMIRTILFVVWIIPALVFGSSLTGDKIIIGIRVEFAVDDSPGTTGDGQFLMSADFDTCGRYTLDPPPHDRNYFLSHFQAIDHYFRWVSYGQLGVDLVQSEIYPLQNGDVYTLSQPMSYYHPYNEPEVADQRLVELFRDAITEAYQRDNIDFSSADVVIVFHAGIGQDFSLPFLDPTPEDIPSTFVDQEMIRDALGTEGITIGGVTISQGVILPETQNHLLYSESNPLLDSAEPCDYQYALTGTLTLMTGFALGFPPLWDTETGESGVGVFSLMDQGSNNARGLIPAPPDAWTRIYAGWEHPQDMNAPEDVSLISHEKDDIAKISMTSSEYFLVEARNNAWRDGVSLDSTRYSMWDRTGRYPPLVEIIIDSVPHTTDPVTGVITGFENYEIGLPGTGLLIWHIDESRIQEGLNSYSINGNKHSRGVDLEEADGAQDIGYPNIFLTADPSAGYFGDLWFKGNKEHEWVNPASAGGYPQFGPLTFPDTRLNSGADSFVIIDSISAPADTMTFILRNGRKISELSDLDEPLHLVYDFDEDGTAEIIGGENRLWTLDSQQDRHVFHEPLAAEFTLVQTGRFPYNQLTVVEATADSFHVTGYQYDAAGAQFSWIWSRSFPRDGDIYYVEGEDDQNRVLIYEENQRLSVSQDSLSIIAATWTDRENMASINLFDSKDILTPETQIKFQILPSGGIQKNDADLTVGFPSVHFSQIIIADLNRDNLPDGIAIANDGLLYAFDVNFALLSGFPIEVGMVRRVLSGDILETEGREIVTQDSSGVITVWGSGGQLQLRFGTDPSDSLLQIAATQGQSILVCQNSAWFISDLSLDESGWTLPNGDVFQSRTVIGSSPLPNPDQDPLLFTAKTYVYPNPAKEGNVTFRITVGTAEKVEVEVYSLAGYFVKRWVLNNPHPLLPNEIRWDVSGQEPGIYFARIIASAGTETETKILKLGIVN